MQPTVSPATSARAHNSRNFLGFFSFRDTPFMSAPYGCSGAVPSTPAPVPPVVAPLPEKESSDPTAEEAEAFIKDVNETIRKLAEDADRAAWVKSTYITQDTEHLESKERERVMEFLSRKVKESRRFEGLELPPDTARSLYLLKFSAGLPAPSDATKRARLAEVTT